MNSTCALPTEGERCYSHAPIMTWLLPFISTIAFAQAPVELSQVDVADFFSPQMISRVAELCLGPIEKRKDKNQNWALMIGLAKTSHPLLFTRFYLRQREAKGAWTSNYLKFAVNEKLRQSVKFHMDQKNTCANVSEWYMNYDGIALDLKDDIKVIFEGEQFGLYQHHEEANPEQLELFTKCVQGEYSAAATIEKAIREATGEDMVLNDDLVDDLYNQVVQPQLLALESEDCAPVKAIHDGAFAKLFALNQRAALLIRRAGL